MNSTNKKSGPGVGIGLILWGLAFLAFPKFTELAGWAMWTLWIIGFIAFLLGIMGTCIEIFGGKAARPHDDLH